MINLKEQIYTLSALDTIIYDYLKLEQDIHASPIVDEIIRKLFCKDYDVLSHDQRNIIIVLTKENIEEINKMISIKLLQK